METMRSDNVWCFQDRFIRPICKVENIILDLKSHAGGPPELLHADQIPSVNASDCCSYSRCRSEKRGCFQVRNCYAFTYACIEISEDIKKFSFTNIDQGRSNHSHHFRILVIGQELNALRSEKQSGRQGLLIAKRHVNSGSSPTNLILIDHIIKDQSRGMDYLNRSGSFQCFLWFPTQGFSGKDDQ